MTNDKRQALIQILGILDAIAAKKARGETISILQNLEEVKYKKEPVNEVKVEPANVSEDSLLDALQGKSSQNKKYKSQRDMDFSYKKTKTRSFSEWCKDNVDCIIIGFCILTILICIFG
ncbi:MAG: hypothetical protein II852_07465 [Bacteroidales bacterium]|nr:hypothetical protein [Bacteroidales bacterium]